MEDFTPFELEMKYSSFMKNVIREAELINNIVQEQFEAKGYGHLLDITKINDNKEKVTIYTHRHIDGEIQEYHVQETPEGESIYICGIRKTTEYKHNLEKHWIETKIELLN